MRRFLHPVAASHLTQRQVLPQVPLCDDSAMMISAPCVVSLTWEMSDAQGQLIDELNEPTEFFFGGSDLLPKVEEALQDHAQGDELHIHLEPEHAFGDYDSSLVCFEDRKLFPENVEVGMHFDGLPAGAVTPDMPAERIYTVTEVYPSHVVLDGNHPLAGLALRLKMQVVDVREPTVEEAQAGSLGGAGLSILDGTTPAQNHLH